MDYDDEIDAMQEHVNVFLQKHGIAELWRIVGEAIDQKIYFASKQNKDNDKK